MFYDIIQLTNLLLLSFLGGLLAMEESNNRELRNEKGQTLEEFLEAYDENKYPRDRKSVV